MTFIIKPAYDETGEITELFSEYTQMLIEKTLIFRRIWICSIMTMSLKI